MHVLRPNDPTTLRLLARAGVPESRLLRPIITMVEDHMLIHEQDIRAITEQLGASPDYYWYHDFKRVEGWETFLEDAARPREGEEGTVTEDTVLVMNGGAHWSRHELSMLPDGESDEEEQSRVVATYKQMINLIMSRLSPIPQLSVIYRATSPGHPNCNLLTVPYRSLQAAQLGERNLVERLISTMPDEQWRTFRKRWDWDLFAVHNALWEREIASREEGMGGGGVKWIFMDVWDQALQRPDAHTEPGTDCLHWNLPGIFEQWTDQIYHILFLERERKKAKAV
ncbi:hypothetical protein K443DRAFT_440431 [Laccaria amethystina LaAM-08-1]|uniref:Unplaced genomic scaffold K443scaffold_388, whole genome shotgun sequence n=1 Tax=Laccaria amethystina LaAM-08-1 TaxID=1095629 RepID=A0A0C9X3L9_9AGAR|nr:hypothetical protein K443DRAFT_440431 [Laccaria amethystina LaAM-08-1]